MKSQVKSAMIAIALTIPQVGFAASTVNPNVQFDFELKEDAVAKTCQIVMPMSTYPDAEGVNVRILAASIKAGPKQVFIGLHVDVGDFAFSHGKAMALTPKPITSATISAQPGFVSTAMKDVSPGNGGFTAVALDNEPVVKQLLETIIRGDYLVAFQRADADKQTIYAVHPALPQDVMLKFAGCWKSLHFPA